VVYGVKPSTHHRQLFADVLFADGHVRSRPNRDQRFTENLTSYADLITAFDKILQVLEQADTEP